jgi:rhodanese-related sulfurtransferase
MRTLAPALPLLLALACVSRTEGQQATPSGAAVAGVSPGIVDAQQARKLVDAGVKIVDVRTPAEFQAGHVPGALNIPYDELARRTGEIGPPSTPVLVYCRSGRRSGIATEELRKQGFGQIFDLQAYRLWTAAESP